MLVVFFTSIIALYLTFLDSSEKLDNGLKYAFALLTLVPAIRYNYGNDYMSYLEEFNYIGNYSFYDIFFLQEQMQYEDAAFKDIGAALLYKLFNPLGFFAFSAIICIIESLIYYQFIKENVERSYYWLALYIYLFQFDFYVLPMSMIRQGLTIALFVWTWHFLKQNKYIVPIILAIISFTIHKSSVIIIPFIVLNLLSYNNRKIVPISVFIMTIVLFGSSVFVGELFNSIMELELMNMYMESYKDEEGNKIGIVRILLAVIPYMLALYYMWTNEAEEKARYLVLLSIVGFLILPFTFNIHLVSREAYYFNIFMVASIPLCVSSIKIPLLKYGIPSMIMMLLIYQYMDLFFNSIYTEKFATYHTIFSVFFE